MDRDLREWGLDGLANALASRARRNDVCPHCQTTRVELRKNGTLGCPLCYVVFQDDVERLINAAKMAGQKEA